MLPRLPLILQFDFPSPHSTFISILRFDRPFQLKKGHAARDLCLSW